MENPVGDLMTLGSKHKLNRPDFQYRKVPGKWPCTCVMTVKSQKIEETAIGQTKKEVKTQTSRQILPVLKPLLN